MDFSDIPLVNLISYVLTSCAFPDHLINASVAIPLLTHITLLSYAIFVAYLAFIGDYTISVSMEGYFQLRMSRNQNWFLQSDFTI